MKNIRTFQNHQNQLEVPYVIYASAHGQDRRLHMRSHQNQLQKDSSPRGMRILLHHHLVQWTKPITCRLSRTRCCKHLLEHLQQEEDKITKIISKPEPIWITMLDNLTHQRAMDCHICDKPLVVPFFKDAIDE